MLGVGQQFLAYAIHPDTGQPYTWPGRELVDTPIAELPEITEQQALDFIAYFESIVPPDWTPVTRKSERLRREGIHKTSKTPFAPISKLRLALDAIPIASNDPYDTWLKVGVALYHASEGSQDALALWHEWSRKGSKYNPDALDQRWKGFGRAPGKSYLSAASIFQWADNADPSWRDRAREQERIEHERAVQRLVEKMANEAGTHDADDAGDAGVPPSFKIFSLAEFDGKPIPEREWVVEGLIPARNVTDLSGDGGVGNADQLLALQRVSDKRGTYTVLIAAVPETSADEYGNAPGGFAGLDVRETPEDIVAILDSSAMQPPEPPHRRSPAPVRSS